MTEHRFQRPKLPLEHAGQPLQSLQEHVLRHEHQQQGLLLRLVPQQKDHQRLAGAIPRRERVKKSLLLPIVLPQKPEQPLLLHILQSWVSLLRFAEAGSVAMNPVNQDAHGSGSLPSTSERA